MPKHYFDKTNINFYFCHGIKPIKEEENSNNVIEQLQS